MAVEPVTPAIGWGVLHLFCKPTETTDIDAVKTAVKEAEAAGDQVVAVAVLGHKADLAFMALGDDLWRLRRFQSAMQQAGLDVVDSYLSLTELSEYAKGIPEAMREARLHPQLPPADKPAWCFYPMSKRRSAAHNWYRLAYHRRKRLMYEHGASGRKFTGRVLQLITGSTGIDDYEWGVTLFALTPDVLKEVVYTMRFDEASADYAEFGSFYTGMVASVDDVLAQVHPG